MMAYSLQMRRGERQISKGSEPGSNIKKTIIKRFTEPGSKPGAKKVVLRRKYAKYPDDEDGQSMQNSFLSTPCRQVSDWQLKDLFMEFA